MQSAVAILNKRISKALDNISGKNGSQAIVKASANTKFGDYQANGVMALAKELKCNPRELAVKVVEALELDDICYKPEVAGPGFINLKLKEEYIFNALKQINLDDENALAIDKTDNPLTIVVDYSGPNIAKEMHVGHLRSTIIGDCICQMLEFLGHNTIRQNHIGDWGTQFGMLCALLARKIEASGEDNLSMELSNLEAFYKEAKALYDADDEFAKTARAAIAGLHAGDEKWKDLWQKIVVESRKHYTEIYKELKVVLSADDERGESAYRNELQSVVDEIKTKDIAEESEGAICVFPEGFKSKEDEPLPFIIQKTDGAFLYATYDLAALRYRIRNLNANRIVYVTDARQMLHFQMLFATATMAGITKKDTDLVHVTFGTMLGEDGKPFKTRSGENVKLKDLLQEAINKAQSVVDEKNPDLEESTRKNVARAVGIGAVKYSDYSNNRTTDYIFSFDKMLAMDGNTAPYMQYAYARIKSIERKAILKDVNPDIEIENLDKVELNEQAELELAKHLLKYGEAINAAAADYRPNFLTTYLYDLAQKFSSFYNNCPVLLESGAVRASRLLLCRVTAKTIKHGLTNILRIDVPEQM